jgi:uncharacterized protein YcfJ
MNANLNRMLAGLASSTLATAAIAVPADFVDTAPVLYTSPIVERVSEPRQECWTETQASAPAPRGMGSYVAPAIGAVVGGLLGSLVGSGNGRVVASATGAAVGAMAGHAIGNDNAASNQPVQRCRTVDATREVIQGYNVVYRYNGQDISTTLPYDPGQTVRVGVGILDSGTGAAGEAGYPGAARSPYTPAGGTRYDVRYPYRGAPAASNSIPYYSY